jgi:hypothetical protein
MSCSFFNSIHEDPQVLRPCSPSVFPFAQEISLIVTVIVILVIEVRGQDQAYRTRGEIYQFPPDHGTNIQSVIGTGKVITFFLRSVVQNDIKTSGHRDDELLEILVRVRTSLGIARDIIKIVYSLDIERDMVPTFNKSQVPPVITDPGKIYYFTFIQAQITPPVP